MPIMTLSEIETLCRDALLNVGASQEQADIVAAEIADAEAEGIRNVGLGLHAPVLETPQGREGKTARGSKDSQNLSCEHGD